MASNIKLTRKTRFGCVIAENVSVDNFIFLFSNFLLLAGRLEEIMELDPGQYLFWKLEASEEFKEKSTLCAIVELSYATKSSCLSRMDTLNGALSEDSYQDIIFSPILSAEVKIAKVIGEIGYSIKSLLGDASCRPDNSNILINGLTMAIVDIRQKAEVTIG